MLYVPAKMVTVPEAPRKVRLVVIHTMESPEGIGTARAVAEWFGGIRGEAPRASAHYCIDNREVIQCVPETGIAAHAPGVNTVSIGVEHAGRASQGLSGWSDLYSQECLSLSAQLVADICRRHKIPVRRPSIEALHDDPACTGIVGHYDVTCAFRRSTHTDPGPYFPWASYLAQVARTLAALAG